MGLFFGTQTPIEEPSEDEEEISEQEEASEEELSEEEEVDQEETESDASSTEIGVPRIDEEQFKLEREERLEFQRGCREIFLTDWLPTEGGWLSELEKPQLDFLRDILGLPDGSTYSPRSWPAYCPW